MARLVITCGLAFSGKSTGAREIARILGAELISLDAINEQRGLNGGQGMTVAQWEETSFMAVARTEEKLRDGRIVVVDDTFSHRILRDRFRDVAARTNAEFTLLFFDTSLDVIRARIQANRLNPCRHDIRDEIFEPHLQSFQFPANDEPVVRAKELQSWLRSINGNKAA